MTNTLPPAKINKKNRAPIIWALVLLALIVATPFALRARTTIIQGVSNSDVLTGHTSAQDGSDQELLSGGSVATASANTGTAGAVSDTGNTPSRLIIPSLGISSHVQAVGLTPTGNMDIAHSAVDVAWYKLGPKPGEIGSAVINGHINTYYSAHGVFEHLDRLNPGDIVEVQAENGALLKFVVTGKKTFDYNAPTGEIFADNSGRYLNLITCAGEWMTDKHLYDKRLVVFTKLQQ